MKKLIPALITSLIPLVSDAQTFDSNAVEQRMRYHRDVLGVEYRSIPKVEKTEVIFNKFTDIFDPSFIPRYCPLTDTIYDGLGDIAALDHELGHHYTNEVSRDIGLANFPVNADCTYVNNGHKLIGEGIAFYFELRINDREDEHLRFSHFYKWAYMTVKPVLDLDIRYGVEYLIKHFPTEDDMDERSLEAYKWKAVEEVRKQVGK